MLITVKRWNEVRDMFSEEEKSVLRDYAGNEVICPPGWTVDVERMPKTLADKVRRLCGEKSKAG